VNVEIRAYYPGTDREAATLFAIFFEAVRDGAGDHYTLAQRQAWAPDTEMPTQWPDKLAKLHTVVAEVDDEIAGFMAATPQGYVDLAFVRPRWMGRGVAQAVYDGIVEWARRSDLTCLTTHAGHLARPFSARQGWQVDTIETIDRNGEALTRFAMSVELGEYP
jgi:putative acetyltransferase